MPTGFVKWFNDTKGYGFIQPDDGSGDAFVHISALERSGMRTLRENQRLSYDLEEGRQGKTSAVNLRAEEEVEQSSQVEQTEPSDSPDSE